MPQTAHTDPIEFQNERFHATMFRKEACRVELRIKAFSTLIEDAKREATKAVNKEVSLPGFRKGKAPEELIRKKFPRDIEKELHNKLANTAFSEAQKMMKLSVLNGNTKITFDLKHLSPTDAELLFSFETEPKVPTVDPKLFQPKEVERAEVGEKQINEAIRQMQFYFAEWIPITDRPIQEKDTISIDLDTLDDETPKRIFNGVRFEVVPERMAEWMQRLVIGAKAGDVLEGISEPDANATEEEKKEFLPKKVRITVLKVEEAKLPDLDDAFAHKVGTRDVEHLRQSVTDMLTKQADDHVKEKLREQVNEFIVAQYPFELPQSLIDTERNHRWQQLNQNPKFKNDWAKMSQEERSAFEKNLRDESANAVRLFYLARQIVNDAKISITHKEVVDTAVASLKALGSQQLPVDQIPQDVYAVAVSKVMLTKAQDFILNQSR